jgi:hypothetical protein
MVTVLPLPRDRFSIVLVDPATIDPKHGPPDVGADGRGYTDEGLRVILTDRYDLPPAENEETIALAKS